MAFVDIIRDVWEVCVRNSLGKKMTEIPEKGCGWLEKYYRLWFRSNLGSNYVVICLKAARYFLKHLSILPPYWQVSYKRGEFCHHNLGSSPSSVVCHFSASCLICVSLAETASGLQHYSYQDYMIVILPSFSPTLSVYRFPSRSLKYTVCLF